MKEKDDEKGKQLEALRLLKMDDLTFLFWCIARLSDKPSDDEKEAISSDAIRRFYNY